MSSASQCPKGHQSSEPDYCSECGAKMTEAAAAPAAPAAVIEEFCPKCATRRDDPAIAFCEACGYNFVTGTGGAERVAAAAPVAATHWTITISVDPALREAGSPEPPANFSPFTVALTEPASLIGRKSVARAIDPEIPLSHDDAVSHRHALLQLGADGGLQLRDIGSSNGTRLNGKDVQPMVDYALKDGDEMTLGHWSRLVVKAV